MCSGRGGDVKASAGGVRTSSWIIPLDDHVGFDHCFADADNTVRHGENQLVAVQHGHSQPVDHCRRLTDASYTW